MASSRTHRLSAVGGGVVVAVVLAAGAAAGAYVTTGAVRDPAGTGGTAGAAATGAPSAVSAATVAPRVAPTTRPPTASRTDQTFATALRTVLADPALGARVRFEIRDVATGRVLAGTATDAPTAPASTAKLLTAAAILTVSRGTDRLLTRVVSGPGSAVTLIGGGDPTISCAAAGRPGAYDGAARISDLAAQLRRAGVAPTAIVVDDSLYSGPSVSPGWAAEDLPSSYATPETAVMCDGGRAAPTDTIRSLTPDLDAGRALAAALGRPGLPVTRGRAPVNGALRASVRSAPLSTLVAQMLQQSDNVIAESLGRQVALAQGRPASFAGTVSAVRAVLSRLGVDPGAGMLDASGLAAADRLSAATLAGVVALAAGPARPDLHTVIAALPVAGWSGTLTDRYVTGASAAGAGLVRAKTGTLTGVSTLAGVVHDRSGRLLAFALMADRAGPTLQAEAALDAAATRLSACGCR